MAKLIIIRGLPGSGKSTLARVEQKSNKYILQPASFEADDYFIRPDEVYDFNPKLLKNAHDWCFNNVVNRFVYGSAAVIVSNTFTTYKEMKPYVDYAKENGHELEIITCTGEYQNIHNVPEETLKRMKDRFESHESVLEKAGLK